MGAPLDPSLVYVVTVQTPWSNVQTNGVYGSLEKAMHESGVTKWTEQAGRGTWTSRDMDTHWTIERWLVL